MKRRDETIRWRAHRRVIAVLITGPCVLSLIGMRAWTLPVGGLGMPVIVPPVVALLALVLSDSDRGVRHRRSL
jgi:hypothetical protein